MKDVFSPIAWLRLPPPTPLSPSRRLPIFATPAKPLEKWHILLQSSVLDALVSPITQVFGPLSESVVQIAIETLDIQ